MDPFAKLSIACGLMARKSALFKSFAKFERVAVFELNDAGLYGYGQLATLLRARFTDPKIQSITKTDGLGFKIREIVAGVEKLRNNA